MHMSVRIMLGTRDIEFHNQEYTAGRKLPGGKAFNVFCGKVKTQHDISEENKYIYVSKLWL